MSSRGRTNAEDCACSMLLLLSPPLLEQEFWTQRTLFAIDAFAVVHALVMNAMLFKTFKVLSTDHMMPHERVAVLLYPLIAVWHIYYMASRPKQYQKHRLHIMLVNRIVRLLLMVATAVLSTPATAHKMAIALPGWQHFVHNATSFQQGTAAAAAAGDVLQPPISAPGDTAFSMLGQAMQQQHHEELFSIGQFIKPVCGPVMVWLGYSHFIVPLWISIPLQAATLILALLIARVRVCWFLTRRGMQRLVFSSCNTIGNFVYASGMFFGWPWSQSEATRQACSDPVAAALVITLFSHTMLLIIVPLVSQYAVELALKRQFVRLKGMRLSQPVTDTMRVTVVVGVAAPVAGWLLCAAAVAAMPVLTCNDNGWLVKVRRV